MAGGRGGLGETGASRLHVVRTMLMGEIDAELGRSGIVQISGPWGYGRTTLARDYARAAHMRTPSRPVARIDFDTYEAQAFLTGNYGPFLRSLRRRASRGATEGPHGDAAQTPAMPPPGRRACRPRSARVGLRPLPDRYASNATHLLYECMSSAAPAWRAAFESEGLSVSDDAMRRAPLVVVDNLPRMDEGDQGSFADALMAWSRAGARFIVVSSPSTRIPGQMLPGTLALTSDALSVRGDELELWRSSLCIGRDVPLDRVAGGVPLLVDACRLAHADDPRLNRAFLRASGRVVERCLDELMCGTAERGRWAMVLLGEGTLAQLGSVGVRMREDELAILAQEYPLFGVDVLAGTFACVPVSCGRDGAAAARAACADEDLSVRCIELLVSQNRLRRAGELAALLSEARRLELFGRHPDAFADAAHAGSIERSMKVAAMADRAPTAGFARLMRLHAIAHDVPVRLLPECVRRVASGTSSGALRAVKTVLDCWCSLSLAPGDSGDAQPDGEAGCARCDESLGAAQVVPPGGVDALVRSLAVAGLRGDGGEFARQVSLLCDEVPFDKAGLAAAVYACHVAVCGFLCDRAEQVLAFVEPLAARAGDCEPGRDGAGTVSHALLGAVCAVARMLVERPSAGHVALEAIDEIRLCRRFLEEHRVEPAVAFVTLLESLCLMLAGAERQAGEALEYCRLRWAARGFDLGQLAVLLLLCVSDLACGAVNQALVHAGSAEALARRAGVRRGAWMARLFAAVAAARNGNVPDLDRRLLEATLRRTALYPAVSVTLELELAVLHAARGDQTEARDVVQGVSVFDRPFACRLLVVVLRALGKSKSALLSLVARRLRAEYESLRPATLLRRCSAAAEAPAASRRTGACSSERKVVAVSVLGGLRVSVNGHTIKHDEWGRRKARNALLVMALNCDAPISRSALIDALWEGSSRSAAMRNNLSTILSSLRSVLRQRANGPQYIVTMGESVGFNLELVDVDVVRFESLARTVVAGRHGADPVELLDACSKLEVLYGAGFDRGDLRELSREVRERADGMGNLFADCMMVGVEVALSEGDGQLALWFARAAERERPHRGDVRTALAAALAAAGRTAALAVSEEGPAATSAACAPRGLPCRAHVNGPTGDPVEKTSARRAEKDAEKSGLCVSAGA